MRVSGNTAWLEKKDWQDFCEYEEQLNSSITDSAHGRAVHLSS
jgi:hypothetical protein